MYPGPDSQADQFDAAWERRRSGDTSPVDDKELEELLDLSLRLEQELPDDLPDPAFRQDLKHQLLYDTATEPVLEPVDLDRERWHRRLIASPWRISAAAAACLVVVVFALLATVGPFSGGPDDDGQEVTSFQPVDADDTAEPDESTQTNHMPLDVDDGVPESEQWFMTTFPSFDVEHMVLPPLMFGFLPFSERQKPEVELLGLRDMMDDADMPETAPVYYLNAPPDGATMLTTLRSTLGVDGELVESNGDGDPYRIVDQDQNDIMRWDPTSAFFHFQGDVLDEPVDDLLDPDAMPAEVARRFLELIGFDLYTIEYEEHLVESGGITEVQFRPHDFPQTGLEISFGGSVFVDQDGAIREAQLYWLSLVDIEVVALRDPEDIIEDIENGNGYTPPTADDSDEMWIDVKDMMMIHVLTRLGESNFVLQPAVKFVGDYGDEVVTALPGPARYFVPAAENSD